MNDLEFVPFLQLYRGPFSPLDHIIIEFYCDPFIWERKMLDQFLEIEILFEFARLAV